MCRNLGGQCEHLPNALPRSHSLRHCHQDDERNGDAHSVHIASDCRHAAAPAMILAIRVGEIEATFDSDEEFVTPEAAQDYLLRAARVAKAVWVSLPNAPAEATLDDGDDATSD